MAGRRRREANKSNLTEGAESCMVAHLWPAWVSWLMLVAVFLTFILVWMMMGSLAAVRRSLADKPGEAMFQNREELEKRFAVGAIDRDVYERWKARLR